MYGGGGGWRKHMRETVTDMINMFAKLKDRIQ